MTKKLISMGHNVNHKKISRIMRENGLNSVVRRRKYRPEVYERRKLLKETVPANILQRNFYSPTPRTIFVTDITYIYPLLTLSILYTRFQIPASALP